MASRDYLLSKYGVAPSSSGGKATKIKKKRAPAVATATTPSKLAVMLKDDDAEIDWQSVAAAKQDEEDAKNEIVPVVVDDEGLLKFRPLQSAWIPVGLPETQPASSDTPLPKARPDSESDLSPPRKVLPSSTTTNQDLSPPRRGGRHSDDDQDPPRRESTSTSQDLSPPRRRDSESRVDTQAQSSKEKDARMQSGAKAGLQLAKDTHADAIRRKQEEKERLMKLPPEKLGKSAQTVYRDKSGKQIDLQLEKAKKIAAEKAKLEEEERQMEWGKGLVQKREREKRLNDMQHEMAKPFARYADDEDMNTDLKSRDRWGDPMAEHFAKKRKAEGGPERPKYRGPPAPPNRFGIPPGYRWDGVDRSNGFETKLMVHSLQKETQAVEAYKWAVSDM